MCGTCGCGRPEAATIHHHEPEHSERRLAVERSLLEENEKRAERLRVRLRDAGIEGVALLGGPGSGKTTLLEATLDRLGGAAAAQAVVEGDCATDHDARRIATRGARVVQVATGSLCHLDAHLVEHALAELDLAGVERLWIENVGNLVCPAPFPCGESRRVALVSVAEGDDKPEKYPALFARADLLVVSKLDLLPHVDFDPERCERAARRLRPGLATLRLSARTGEGLGAWLDWVHKGEG